MALFSDFLFQYYRKSQSMALFSDFLFQYYRKSQSMALYCDFLFQYYLYCDFLFQYYRKSQSMALILTSCFSITGSPSPWLLFWLPVSVLPEVPVHGSYSDFLFQYYQKSQSMALILTSCFSITGRPAQWRWVRHIRNCSRTMRAGWVESSYCFILKWTFLFRSM